MRLKIKNYISSINNLADLKKKFPTTPNSGHWKTDEITNKTGWLNQPSLLIDNLDEIENVVNNNIEDFENLVTVGMGGSSRPTSVAKMFRKLFDSDGLDLHVLETLDEEYIKEFMESIDLERTLFIVVSKSGSTSETISLTKTILEHTDNLLVITSKSEENKLLNLLEDNSIDGNVLEYPKNIGGRYSFFTKIGLLPLGFSGINLRKILDAGREGMRSDKKYELGKFLYDMESYGKIHCRIVCDDDLGELGEWVEQLISESLGKRDNENNERGILSVVERNYLPEKMRNSDIFVLRIKRKGSSENKYMRSAYRTDTPVVDFEYESPEELANFMYQLEFAVGMSGILMDIDPFNQPGVDMKKQISEKNKEKVLSDNSDERFEGIVDSYRSDSRLEIYDDLYLDYGLFVEVLEEYYDIEFNKELLRLSLDKKEPVDVFKGILRVSNMLDKTFFAALPYNEKYKDHEVWSTFGNLAMEFGFLDVLGNGPVYEHSLSQYFHDGYNYGLFGFVIRSNSGSMYIPDNSSKLTLSMQNTLQGLSAMKALSENKIPRLTFWFEVKGDKPWKESLDKLNEFFSDILDSLDV